MPEVEFIGGPRHGWWAMREPLAPVYEVPVYDAPLHAQYPLDPYEVLTLRTVRYNLRYTRERRPVYICDGPVPVRYGHWWEYTGRPTPSPFPPLPLSSPDEMTVRFSTMSAEAEKEMEEWHKMLRD